ncbi:MAG: prolyl oligopeptidase family serine peptidase, partial [Propionibacterium sp.]|nr:prolyl oligopeptidase family serine peptidase [Propionibacterium sp.]
LLVDEEEQARGQEFFRLPALSPSPDATRIAWQRDLSGDERWDVLVQDVATGAVLDQGVTGTGQGLAWSADGRFLLYPRVDKAWRQHQVWLHEVGTDPSTDRLVLEEPDERFALYFAPCRDRAWVEILAESTTTSEVWLWSTTHPECAPIPVTGRTRDVLVDVEPAGDHLLLLHSATSREGTLAAAALPGDLSPFLRPLGGGVSTRGCADEGDAAASRGAAAGDAITGSGADADARALPLLAPPDSWVPLREAAPGERLLGVEAFSTFMLLSLRSQGLTQVEYHLRANPCTDVSLTAQQLGTVWDAGRFVESDSPVRTIESAAGPRFEDRSFRVEHQSLAVPPQVVEVDPRTGARRVLKELEVPGWDAGDYVEERVWVTARDGHTRVPVSLVHRRDVEPGSGAPGWIYGYGSYEVSIDPYFSVMRLPLLERGVVYAIAHVRGGGEMGRAWYEDGKLERKPHTFTDFVDVAHWLVSSGWVGEDRLVAEGRSAGGLLMGAVANLDPSAFRVVLAGVPFVDALTTILDPSLPLTVGEWEEWGNPIESEQIYRVMRSYSPYENVREGTQYPAIFASTSLNDTRVFFVEPAKWVQRLRAAATNDPVARPIVLRTQMVAGHGGKSGRYGAWDSRAEEFAFALGQVGVSD